MSKLSVQLVTWNGAKYVPYLFASLRNQEYKNWKLYILDNASEDGMVDAMKKEIENFPVEVELVESKENTGFAGGHNKLFKQTDSEYVLLLNQDMYVMSDCFGKMVTFLDERRDVAAVSPRLMRWDFKKIRNPKSEIRNPEESFTDQVDAMGLKIFRNRRVVEQCTGRKWEEIKDAFVTSKDLSTSLGMTEGAEVFGVSGAFPMFRRADIEEIAFDDGTFFDESYGSYKEDVDLAFRLQSAGKKTFVLPQVIAYHDRSAAGPRDMGDGAAAANKKTQSDWVRYHSYKNHLMTMYKNKYWQNHIIDLPWIAWYELKKLVWLLLFDRKVLKGIVEMWKLRAEMREKRREIKGKRKVDWKALRVWWV